MDSPSTSSSGKRIVLVEDEEILANILSEKLSKAGYQVHVTRDGEEGLDAILKEKPDLVLLDILLPKKNGYEVLQHMADAGLLPHMPVIIISNSGQPVEIDYVMKLGVRDYLVKINFDPDEVLAKVESILSGASGSPRAAALHGTAPSAPKPIPAGEGGTGLSVLVVEDDIFIADLLCRKLHEAFTVYQASDTFQAEKVLAENHVDIICLDIILPGKDGYTFLGELKQNEKYRDIPVIILSNLGQREEIDRGIQAGAVDYLIKANSSPEEILRRVIQIAKNQGLNTGSAN